MRLTIYRCSLIHIMQDLSLNSITSSNQSKQISEFLAIILVNDLPRAL